MKISTLAAFGSLALSGAFAFTVACDDGGASFECTEDADCESADNPVAENTVCDTDVGVCVEPSDPVCENDTDCDLQDTSEGSPIDEAPAGGCAADEFAFTGFDGLDYCGVEDEAGFCAGAGFATADVDGTTICILDDGTCDEDGQCG